MWSAISCPFFWHARRAGDRGWSEGARGARARAWAARTAACSWISGRSPAGFGGAPAGPGAAHADEPTSTRQSTRSSRHSGRASSAASSCGGVHLPWRSVSEPAVRGRGPSTAERPGRYHTRYKAGQKNTHHRRASRLSWPSAGTPQGMPLAAVGAAEAKTAGQSCSGAAVVTSAVAGRALAGGRQIGAGFAHRLMHACFVQASAL